MNQADRALFLLGLSLALLAGYVDALGYLSLRGYFVSFMSGNSTQLAVGAIRADRHAMLTAGPLVVLFVLGVALGSRVARRALLWCIAAGLSLAAVFGSLGRAQPALALAAIAMGAANNVVQKAGPVTVGATYMTGTLVRLGQALARPQGVNWLPYLLLWLGLVGGAAIGAAAFARIGLSGLWLAAFCCVLVLLADRRIPA